MKAVLRAAAGQLVLLPLVALASFYLMAALPPPAVERARTVAEQRAADERYRRDLGAGEALGFTRPWRALFRGEPLGASGQGVDGATIARKFRGSVTLGLLALSFVLPLAALFALARARARGPLAHLAPDALASLAYATPVFIPGMLLAPHVVATSDGAVMAAAALVLAAWPAAFLGGILEHAVRHESRREYARTARGKGLGEMAVVARHVLPNVAPTLLDALRPVATALLAGSFAAEKVFGLHFFGELYVRAVIDRQASVVVVCTTLFAALLVAVGLAVDLARGVFDPRARESVSGSMDGEQ